MDNNYILKKVRYALDINDKTLLKIFKLGGTKLLGGELYSYSCAYDSDEYVPLPKKEMNSFLNGLIIFKRGKKDGSDNYVDSGELDNNIIMKKLKIAFNLKDIDILDILKKEGLIVSKNQLSALFRSKTNSHYMPCKDQLLRKFVQGLTKSRNKKKDTSMIFDFNSF